MRICVYVLQDLVLESGGAQHNMPHDPQRLKLPQTLACGRDGVVHEQPAIGELHDRHSDVDGDVQEADGLLKHPHIWPRCPPSGRA